MSVAKEIKETDVGIITDRLNTLDNIAESIREKAAGIHIPSADEGDVDPETPTTVGPMIMERLRVLNNTLTKALESLRAFN
ncbi:hypothetical protein ES708_00725 [subsurface metagenome]